MDQNSQAEMETFHKILKGSKKENNNEILDEIQSLKREILQYKRQLSKENSEEENSIDKAEDLLDEISNINEELEEKDEIIANLRNTLMKFENDLKEAEAEVHASEKVKKSMNFDQIETLFDISLGVKEIDDESILVKVIFF